LFSKVQKIYLHKSKSLEILNVTNKNLLEDYRLIVERRFAWPGELCWRERKLLVGPPVPDTPKGRSQTKCPFVLEVRG
jgi:hypothetical protein